MSTDGVSAGRMLLFDVNAMEAVAQRQPRIPSEPEQASGPTAQLKELFPSYEDVVLEAVLVSCDGNVEGAVATLLEMQSATAASSSAANIDQDEELALSLFREFAGELDENVPQEIREDPDRYEAYAQEQYDNFVAGREQSAGGARSAVLKRRLCAPLLICPSITDATDAYTADPDFTTASYVAGEASGSAVSLSV